MVGGGTCGPSSMSDALAGDLAKPDLTSLFPLFSGAENILFLTLTFCSR